LASSVAALAERFVSGEDGLCLLDKSALLHVDVDGVRDMAFSEFLGGSHIEQNHLGICNLCGETVDVSALEALLIAGGGQAQKSQ